MVSADPGQANAKTLDVQSWNGYAYVQSNPIVFTDPKGLEVYVTDKDTADRMRIVRSMKKGMSKKEKKNIEWNAKTGQFTLKDKDFKGASPQYRMLAEAIDSKNKSSIQLIEKGETVEGTFTGVSVEYGEVMSRGGGMTVHVGDKAGDADSIISRDGVPANPAYGTPVGRVLGEDESTSIPQPFWLLVQHEALCEAAVMMTTDPPFSSATPIERENEIRRYGPSPMPLRGGGDHE